MKKIYIVLSLILILTFRYYYEHEDKMLDKAIIYAKENRNELKKVLKYYKNDKADTPNTLQPVNGMNDFLFASRFVSIRPRACFFPLFSFLPLWLHYNLNPLCVQY